MANNFKDLLDDYLKSGAWGHLLEASRSSGIARHLDQIEEAIRENLKVMNNASMQIEEDHIRYGDAVCCNTCDTCIYDHGEVLEVSLDANYQMQAKVAWTATGGMEYWPVSKLKKVGGGAKTAESAVCRHKWLVYHGLNETFEYCGTCDEKKT